MRDQSPSLSWFSIIRLGLVQMALGAMVVLSTSTLNRVMVVELAFAATVPGALVALHYVIQMSRPRWGFGSDMGGRRTPWIIGGMAVLAFGGFLAAIGTAMMAEPGYLGIMVSILAFSIIGVGVGAAGTSLLAFLATAVSERRRPAAASIVWIMMIAGIAITAGTAGQFLDPFSFERLITVAGVVSGGAFILAMIAVWGVERSVRPATVEHPSAGADAGEKPRFIDAFREVWAESKARQFTIFVFVSMLAYSAQDLILEPFAGLVFGFTPGESTSLAGVQHGGVFLGMVLVALAGSGYGRGRFGSMRFWAVGGCGASALAFVGLCVGAMIGPEWPLRANVFFLGLANGAFAVAAVGSMMGLANQGKQAREGTRMGLWGASQAIAFGLGGFLGTVAVDVMRLILTSPVAAYASVFAGEAVLFTVSAIIAYHVSPTATSAIKSNDMTKRSWRENSPTPEPAE